MSKLLEQALVYSARQWSILPVADKIPKGVRSWKKYQNERAPESTLRRWFSKNGVTGVAVICGPVSGGLVVRDFDTTESYDRWAGAYPELAEILPTVRTARGYHVYFTGDAVGIVNVEAGEVHEGELRGAGYVLLPPSMTALDLLKRFLPWCR